MDFPDSVLLDVRVLKDALLPLSPSSFHAGYRQLDPAGFRCSSVRSNVNDRGELKVIVDLIVTQAFTTNDI